MPRETRAEERHLHDALSVLVLGWGGSRPRNLRPFEHLWERLGAETLSYTQPLAENVLRPGFARRRAKELARSLGRLVDRRGGALFVHLLSDNGFIAWSLVLEHLPAQARAALRGVVLDSAPGLYATRDERDVTWKLGRAVTPGILHALGRKPRDEHAIVTPVAASLFRVASKLRPEWVREAFECERRFRAHAPNAQELYLFGDADTFVLPEHVLGFAASRERDGVTVRAVRFPSAHVAHFRDHRARYESELRAFVATAASAATVADPAATLGGCSSSR